MNILVKYVVPKVEEICPLRPARPGDAGMDLCHASDHRLLVHRNSVVRVDSGVRVKIPEGMVGFVRPRSSTFFKKGLFIVEGVIDSGYTGPLYVNVWNPGLQWVEHVEQPLDFCVIEPWARVAQLIVVPFHVAAQTVQDMPVTERGSQGFGSTGG